MHTLELTDRELRLLHNSLETWIFSFSHDQPDLLREGKALRERINAALLQPTATSVSGGAAGPWSSSNG